jgi:hypothetical protein
MSIITFSENTVPIEGVRIKTYLELIRNKSTIKKPQFDSLVARESGLGVKNMKSQDITIITDGRWESTLNLHSLIELDILGVQYEQH